MINICYLIKNIILFWINFWEKNKTRINSLKYKWLRKLLKKIIFFHFQLLFTLSKFDNSAPRRHRNMICAAFWSFFKVRHLVRIWAKSKTPWTDLIISCFSVRNVSWKERLQPWNYVNPWVEIAFSASWMPKIHFVHLFWVLPTACRLSIWIKASVKLTYNMQFINQITFKTQTFD
jgi:hypothetical protein